jgi:hypothetical protein
VDMTKGTPQSLDDLVLAIINEPGGPEYKERLIAIITDYARNRAGLFTLSDDFTVVETAHAMLRHFLTRRKPE